jgi:glycerol-1-phosphatase
MRNRVRVTPADRFEVVLIDLDGTVYVWPQPVPGSPEAVASLRARGCRVGFLTNDPRHDRAGYAERLEKIGVPTSPEEIVTTGVALAVLLRREGFAGAHALVLGTPAFKGEVLAAGLVDGEGADPRTIDLVVVGGSADLGSRELTLATRALRNGARLFGSNRDPVFPTPSGPVPAAGPYLASVEIAGGVVAMTAGKPELPIFEAARQQLGSGSGAMVGDRLDSDVAGGQAAGLAGVLVLSGGTSEEDLAVSPVVPDLICADLAAFAGLA